MLPLSGLSVDNIIMCKKLKTAFTVGIPIQSLLHWFTNPEEVLSCHTHHRSYFFRFNMLRSHRRPSSTPIGLNPFLQHKRLSINMTKPRHMWMIMKKIYEYLSTLFLWYFCRCHRRSVVVTFCFIHNLSGFVDHSWSGTGARVMIHFLLLSLQFGVRWYCWKNYGENAFIHLLFQYETGRHRAPRETWYSWGRLRALHWPLVKWNQNIKNKNYLLSSHRWGSVNFRSQKDSILL